MATVTDPVCGMTFDSSEAVAHSVHEGHTYHFCSEECKRRFEANPEEFLQAKAQS